MKREIKFRAWDKKGREMWGISSIAFGSNDEILWLDLDKEKAYPMENVNPDQVELMQYTGLKDKNGKEIYFGDLVVFKGQDEPMEVEFRGQRIYPYINETTEVVGNIYERNTEI